MTWKPCCCGGGPPGVVCDRCYTLPPTWAVLTMSGWGNLFDRCLNCARLNGTFAQLRTLAGATCEYQRLWPELGCSNIINHRLQSEVLPNGDAQLRVWTYLYMAASLYVGTVIYATAPIDQQASGVFDCFTLLNGRSFTSFRYQNFTQVCAVTPATVQIAFHT